MKVVKTAFDPAEYLEDAETTAFYLEEAFATHDIAYIKQAAAVAARSAGRHKLSKNKALREELVAVIQKSNYPDLLKLIDDVLDRLAISQRPLSPPSTPPQSFATQLTDMRQRVPITLSLADLN